MDGQAELSAGLIVGFVMCWLVCHRYDNLLITYQYGYMTSMCTLTQLCSSPSVPASVAQLDAPSDWRPGGYGFNPRRGWQHSFMEVDHEIFYTVILSLPLIQEGQLSASGERICTILVSCLEDYAYPVDVW